MLKAAYAKAEEIMTNSPIAVELTKEGMWASLEVPGMQPPSTSRASSKCRPR